MNAEQQDALFNNPEKLLQLIVAAEGKKGGGGVGSEGGGKGVGGGIGSGVGGEGGGGTGGEGGGGVGATGAEATGHSATGTSPANVGATLGPPGSGTDESHSRWTSATTGIRGKRPARGGAGSMTMETGLMTLQEDELQGILQVLAQIARTGDAKDRLDPNSFQSRLSTLSRRARFTVSQALAALAAQAPSESSDKPTLLKLAEHIAVRFALESYERGDTRINMVGQMLAELSGELDGLRKVLGVYEEKMVEAGVPVPSHFDLLAQQFWAHIPIEKQRLALESDDAWCVPPLKVRECVETLIKNGEKEAAEKILHTWTHNRPTPPHPTRSTPAARHQFAPRAGRRRAARPRCRRAPRSGRAEEDVVGRAQPLRKTAGRDPHDAELPRRSTRDRRDSARTPHTGRDAARATRVPSSSSPTTSWPSTVPVAARPSFSTSEPHKPQARTRTSEPGAVGSGSSASSARPSSSRTTARTAVS